MKRLDVELVARDLSPTRARARAAIEAGLVRVQGVVVTRPAAQVPEDAKITAAEAHPWVGRAALKLDHALSLWPVAVEGRVVFDLGASTGGFTEVCLACGAKRVFAVDVGHGQLHPRLAADPRVVALERTDARALTIDLIPEPPDLIVCDLSFIGLEKAIGPALGLAAPGADLIALVKPQFQAGPAAVGKGGLVKDPAVRALAVEGVRAFLDASGWPVRGEAESPIAGGDGNVEYLIWATKGR